MLPGNVMMKIGRWLTMKLFSAEMVHTHPQSVLVRVALASITSTAVTFVLYNIQLTD